MPDVVTRVPAFNDARLVAIAREVASDLYSTEQILERYRINSEEWAKLKENPRFISLLQAEIVAWNSAVNMPERIRVKAQAMIEEFLPEAFGRLHDEGEALNHKVEMLKVLKDLAHLGKSNSANGDGGDGNRFNVTINLGADAQLTFQKEQVTSKVIEVAQAPAPAASS